jgi:hypothetical protein
VLFLEEHGGAPVRVEHRKNKEVGRNRRLPYCADLHRSHHWTAGCKLPWQQSLEPHELPDDDGMAAAIAADELMEVSYGEEEGEG